MKKRWDKIVAILGISAMLISQSFCSYAAELELQTENVESQAEVLDEADEAESSEEGELEELEEVAETVDAEPDTESDETVSVLSEEATEEATEETTEETVVRDGTPTNLELCESWGNIYVYFDHNLEKSEDGNYHANYELIFYKDGVEYSTKTSAESDSNLKEERGYLYYFTGYKGLNEETGESFWGDNYINESGVYTCYLRNVDTGVTSQVSNAFVYNRPEELAAPKNVHLTERDGEYYVEWDSVENAEYYQIKLYSTDNGMGRVYAFNVHHNYYNINEYINRFVKNPINVGKNWNLAVMADTTGDTLYLAGDWTVIKLNLNEDTETPDDSEPDNSEPDNSGSDESDSDISSDSSDSSDSTSSSVDTSVVLIDDEQVAGAASVSDAVSKKGAQPIIGTSIGWDSLDYELAKAIDLAGADTQAVLYINLNGTDIIPASAISKVAGKNVLLNIIVDSNIVVNIDAMSLNALEDASDITFATTKNADGTCSLSVRSQNVNIDKNMAVFYNAGIAKVAGTSVLNFVNADQSLLEFRNSTVYENGYAAFVTPLVNADYLLTAN